MKNNFSALTSTVLLKLSIHFQAFLTCNLHFLMPCLPERLLTPLAKEPCSVSYKSQFTDKAKNVNTPFLSKQPTHCKENEGQKQGHVYRWKKEKQRESNQPGPRVLPNKQAKEGQRILAEILWIEKEAASES